MAGLTPALIAFDELDTEGPLTEDSFRAKADLKEGISGQRSFDSTYENVGRPSEVVRPRSDK